jgi:Flp pilus assembly protein TadG
MPLTKDAHVIGQEQQGQPGGARLTRWLKAFAGDRRGNVAMMFALALPLLLMLGLGTIDIHQASRVKANLQDALDAAALAAARSSYSNADEIQLAGMNALKANMPDYFKEGSADTASFVLKDNVLVADAKVNVKALVANIVLPPYGKLLDDYLPVSTTAEVLRASRNVEVGLALDITESMAGQALKDLKVAAKDLVEIIVQDQQKPFYSVMGIIPYSASVNLGPALGLAARGPVRGPTQIVSGAYFDGASRNISGITRNSQATITSNAHGLKNGERIRITNVIGPNSLNDKLYYVADAATNTFKLKTASNTSSFVSTSNQSSYSGGGSINKCIDVTCGLVLTSNQHGFASEDPVHIEGMQGVTSYNNKTTKVTVLDSNRFLLNGSSYSTSLPTANRGTVQCLETGCAKYEFVARSATTKANISDCVTERTGNESYKDTAPGPNRYFGLMYPSVGSRAVCPGSTAMALTSDRDALEDKIEDLAVEGVTAGQIGIAWAWNLVSPNFNGFWGGGAIPGPRDDEKTLKVVVLMTDGEFNMNYCNGVVASNAPGLSYVNSAYVMKNCPATNGNPLTQARSLCTAMKAEGIIVYTVGFKLDESSAVSLMEDCATTKTNHFHNTSSGTQLRDAFRAIGRDITRLRLAR